MPLRQLPAVIGPLLALLSAGAQAQDVTLRVHHFLPATSTTHAQFILPWAERIEAGSDGRISVEVYPAMQLGGAPPNLYDQARDGVADIVWTLPGYTPGRFPIAEVFELPFMPASAEATSQAAHAFYEQHLREEFGDVHVLMVHAHSPGSLHIRNQPVAAREDLEGLRVRAPSRIINDALAALGAVPVGMPVPQVPEALSRGVIDGAVIPFEVARPLRVHELADFHTVIETERGLYTALFLFAMNRDRYQSLPEDLRAVIDANSGLGLAQEIGRVWDQAEEEGRQAAIERGNTFVSLSDSEIERWREAMQPVIDDWVAARTGEGLDGAALLNEARALISRFADGV